MFDEPLSVSQLNNYLSGLLMHDPILRDVRVTGEVLNFKNAASGHYYFSLADDASALKCVMFRSAEDLPGEIKDGASVLASGYVGHYPQRGECQLYVKSIELCGVGALAVTLDDLKRELDALGYFGIERKKPLPQYPACIGVVTSEYGAVIHDIQTVLARRFPVGIKLYSSTVQGERAAEDLARGIGVLGMNPYVDVIILARGGGSAEDLAPFNQRVVLDAIYNCPKPLISAVGHETDTTLADYVADLRAPTPSAAAELAVPSMDAERARLMRNRHRLTSIMDDFINAYKENLMHANRLLDLVGPYRMMENMQSRLGDLTRKLASAYEAEIHRKCSRITLADFALRSFNPRAVLDRGYAMIQIGGTCVNDTNKLSLGDEASIILRDGIAIGKITSINRTGE